LLIFFLFIFFSKKNRISQ